MTENFENLFDKVLEAEKQHGLKSEHYKKLVNTSKDVEELKELINEFSNDEDYGYFTRTSS